MLISDALNHASIIDGVFSMQGDLAPLLEICSLADHWKHDLYTSIGAYTTFDKDEPYQFFVGLPRDRKIEPFVTCRRGSEEGDMYNWGMWIDDRRIWGPNELLRSLNSPCHPWPT